MVTLFLLLTSSVQATMELVRPVGGFLGSYYSKNPNVQYGPPGHNWNDWVVDPNGNDYWWQPVINANTPVLAFNWGAQGWIPIYPMGAWWNGTLRIQSTGYYVFSCENDDGLWVWLDRQTRQNPIIANRIGVAYSQPIFLTAGDHSIEVKYFEDFEWTAPIGASVLFLSMEDRNCDLSVVKSDTFDIYNYDPRLPGQEIVYKTVVTNKGAYTARNISLTDTPPLALDNIQYSYSPQGPWLNWSSPYTLGLGDLLPTESRSIYIKGRVQDGTRPDTITNSVSVTNSVYDIDMSNNTDTEDTTIIGYKINITPEDSTNKVGDEHKFTVRLEKNEGFGWSPAPGESVDLSWSGVGNIISPSSPAITDAEGMIEVTVQSNLPGMGTLITNFSKQTDGATINEQESADKTWIDYNISVTPAASTNTVGDDHIFTIKLLKDEGSGWIDAAGESVDFNWTGVGNIILYPSPMTTDASGEFQVIVHSDTAGSGTLSAKFQRLTDSSMIDISDSGEKTWIGGTVSGYKFNDLNGNGIWEPGLGEKGLPNWTILLTKDGDINEGPVWSTVTDADGYYEFQSVGLGDYKIYEIMQDYWNNTTPKLKDITISKENLDARVDFGNQHYELASISGSKYDDSNGDGVFNVPLELGISDWHSIVLKDSLGNTIQTTQTDQSGNYNFKNLNPGMYIVDEDPSTESAVINPIDPGNLLKSGWSKTTQTFQVTVDYNNKVENLNIGNLWYGWIWGRATDEFSGQPLSGFTITVLETGQTAKTDSNGYYTFPELYPNWTQQYPGETYTVEISLPTGYSTHDSVTKFATVNERAGTRVDFNAYRTDWGNNKTPRTIGYWKNWANHYTSTQMESYISLVKQASGLFTDLTVANISTTYLTITKNSTMQDKARAQLLASWLNVVSANLGVDVVVNVSSIDGWELLIKSADTSGQVTVFSLLTEVDSYFKGAANGTISLTKQSWEVIKDILDKLNNGQLF
jgi:uncharacterized repeat protein (TIGR01451 family)